MQKLEILNKKEAKNIIGILEKQFGFKGELDYVFLLNEKNKVYIVNRDIERIDLAKLRVNSYGIYFCEFNDSKIRLSIEGSQIVGPKATRNILELDDEQARRWLKGEDIIYKSDLTDYIIIKHKDDFLGCGKAVQDKILNYVPKTRRLNVID